MKWIGQHIWDLVSRFRSDVYLEDISTGTIASGGNLGLDSNNKIVKADEASGDITSVHLISDSGNANALSGAANLSVVGGTNISTSATGSTLTINNDLSGTVSSFSLQTDSGAPARYSSTTAPSISILGDSGVGVTNSGGTITATAVPAEIDHDALSNFVANKHIDWTTDQGSTNIHSGNYTNTTYSEATSSDDGLMSTAHHDKLDNIEANADVTDATNVTAAGALMDSECTDLASVKALNQGVATGDSPQFAGINLGHASDTTIARSASGVATIESNIIQTKNKVIYIETANFSDDIDTTKHYIPFVTTSENENFTNIVTPMIAPVNGKLLKVHYKSNQHHHSSSNNITFSLDRVAAGNNWTAGNTTTLGTKVIAGANRVDMGTADFASPDSGTNAFSAGDLIGVAMTNSVDLGVTAKYVVTIVFELDFNSY